VKIVCTSGCCHCPKCWNLDPEAVCVARGGTRKPVYTVQEANDGGIESIIGPGYTSRAAAEKAVAEPPRRGA
jgi:hypothetical protein